jgi:hypothetical protein
MNLNKKLGMFFFKNFNLFTYNVFNLLYKIVISKKKSFSKINNFITNGFEKTDIKIPDDIIDKINTEINSQPIKKKNYSKRFLINDKIKLEIEKIVNNHLSCLIDELEYYYQNNIKLSYSEITRIYNADTNQEYNSNYFHTDGYLFTMFKVFINLQDVEEAHGPLQFFSYKDSKKFFSLNIKNIENYRIKPDSSNNINYFQNTGYKGSVLAVMTPQVLHRAGNPERDLKRDILFLEFVVIPKKKAKIINDLSQKNWNKDNYISKIVSKPGTHRELLRSFFSYL